MPTCDSCGSEIPEYSCSRCYGDISYGKDKYYEACARIWTELQYVKEQTLNETYKEIK